MAGFKAPDFNERTAAARAAKEKALEKLKTKPVADPAVIAAREEARAARDAASAERRAARLREAEEAKAAKAAAAAAAAPPPPPPEPEKPKLTPEEQKAIRDAKYAARKARKK